MALLDVLHLLREIGREAAWMLGFRDRGLGRVHVWVHRNWGLCVRSVAVVISQQAPLKAALLS